jgi:hypothetical protein
MVVLMHTSLLDDAKLAARLRVLERQRGDRGYR